MVALGKPSAGLCAFLSVCSENFGPVMRSSVRVRTSTGTDRLRVRFSVPQLASDYYSDPHNQ